MSIHRMVNDQTSEVSHSEKQQIAYLIAIVESLHEKLAKNTKQLQKIEAELQEFRKGEERRDQEALQRDQRLDRSIRFLKHHVKFIKQITLFTDCKVTKILQLVKQMHKRILDLLALGSTTVLADLTWDLMKEILKESIIEEIEAVAAQVRLILKPIFEPVLGPVWEVVSPIYHMIPKTIMATISIMLIVACIINHAVSIVRALRRG